jgi:hypothetical protein
MIVAARIVEAVRECPDARSVLTDDGGLANANESTPRFLTVGRQQESGAETFAERLSEEIPSANTGSCCTCRHFEVSSP